MKTFFNILATLVVVATGLSLAPQAMAQTTVPDIEFDDIQAINISVDTLSAGVVEGMVDIGVGNFVADVDTFDEVAIRSNIVTDGCDFDCGDTDSSNISVVGDVGFNTHITGTITGVDGQLRAQTVVANFREMSIVLRSANVDTTAPTPP